MKQSGINLFHVTSTTTNSSYFIHFLEEINLKKKRERALQDRIMLLWVCETPIEILILERFLFVCETNELMINAHEVIWMTQDSIESKKKKSMEYILQNDHLALLSLPYFSVKQPSRYSWAPFVEKGTKKKKIEMKSTHECMLSHFSVYITFGSLWKAKSVLV